MGGTDDNENSSYPIAILLMSSSEFPAYRLRVNLPQP